MCPMLANPQLPNRRIRRQTNILFLLRRGFTGGEIGEARFQHPHLVISKRELRQADAIQMDSQRNGCAFLEYARIYRIHFLARS